MPGDSVNIHDAKTNLSRLLERVQAGEQITIARAGTPVAMLVPLPRARTITARDLIERWSELPRLDPDWIQSEELDRKFDDGESVEEHLDLSTTRRPNQVQRRVNVDFPAWMVDQLDQEATRLGVTRQSIIKVWLAERLEQRTTLAARLAALPRLAPEDAAAMARDIREAREALRG